MKTIALIRFWNNFKVAGQEIAYEISVVKPISNLFATVLMVDNSRILSLWGTACADLSDVDYSIDLDEENIEIWMTNKIIKDPDVDFKDDDEFKIFIHNYITKYGWKIDSVNENDPTEEFVKRFL